MRTLTPVTVSTLVRSAAAAVVNAKAAAADANASRLSASNRFAYLALTAYRVGGEAAALVDAMGSKDGAKAAADGSAVKDSTIRGIVQKVRPLFVYLSAAAADGCPMVLSVPVGKGKEKKVIPFTFGSLLETFEAAEEAAAAAEAADANNKEVKAAADAEAARKAAVLPSLCNAVYTAYMDATKAAREAAEAEVSAVQAAAALMATGQYSDMQAARAAAERQMTAAAVDSDLATAEDAIAEIVERMTEAAAAGNRKAADFLNKAAALFGKAAEAAADREAADREAAADAIQHAGARKRA